MLHYCYLPEEYILGDYDVFCGRGTKCHTHIGNRFFRSLIESMLDHYIGSSRREKIDIITEIIQHVRNLCTSHRGGFIKQNLENWRYYEIGDNLAREKVSQAFRDAIREKNRTKHNNKSITKAEIIFPSTPSTDCYVSIKEYSNYGLHKLLCNGYHDESKRLSQSDTTYDPFKNNFPYFDLENVYLEEASHDMPEFTAPIKAISDDDSFFEPATEHIPSSDCLIDVEKRNNEEDDDNDSETIFEMLLQCLHEDQPQRTQNQQDTTTTTL